MVVSLQILIYKNIRFTFLLNSGLRTLFNLKVYFDAKRRLPEFSGLQGRRFPGQPDPLPNIVIPRRPDPPTGHQYECSTSGSWRRSQAKPIMIIVSQADE